MLRRLAQLTVPVPAAGPRALALAIYGGRGGQLEAAPGEGVACVDDAARAVEVLIGVWQATGSRRSRAWAEGLLDFVLWMHQGDGLWINFIANWSGRVNGRGETSRAGVNFWQARALGAVVAAATTLGDTRAAHAAGLAIAAAASADAPPDVRALHVLALQRWLAAGRGGASERALLLRWADRIASVRTGAVLMNSAAERGTPHLWAHVQEAALVAAAGELGRRDLLEVALASGHALYEPVIRAGFDLPLVQPYDVQSAVQVMDSLALATGRAAPADLAALARRWFSGRNPAGLPVYDPATGAVADGIDGREVSRNSGAESNVVFGLVNPPEPLDAPVDRGGPGVVLGASAARVGGSSRFDR